LFVILFNGFDFTGGHRKLTSPSATAQPVTKTHTSKTSNTRNSVRTHATTRPIRSKAFHSLWIHAKEA